MYNLHPCHRGYFILELTEWWKGWLGKEADWCPQNGPPLHLLLKNLPLLRLPFSEHLLGTQITFHIFRPFRNVYPHTSSPDFLVTNFPVVFLPNPWLSSQIIGHSPWIIISISLSKETELPGTLLSLLSTGRISPHHCQKGTVTLQLSIFGCCLNIMQNHP